MKKIISMKKIIRIVLSGALCVLLSAAGAFAAQAPKPEARMETVQELVRILSEQFHFDQAQSNRLQAKLEAIAVRAVGDPTAARRVEFTTAENIAKDMAAQNAQEGEKGEEGKRGKALVKTPERVELEGIVRAYLPPALTELVAGYLPATWNIKFKAGELGSQVLPWGKVYGLQASEDGRYVAAQKNRKTVDIWDMQSLSKVRTVVFEVEGRHWIFSPAFDIAVAVMPGKNRVSVVDVGTGRVSNSIPGFASGLGFFEQPNGERCLISYNHRLGNAYTWDLSTTQLLKQYPLKDFLGKVESLLGQVIFSVDGKLIAGEKEGELIVWDVENDRLVQKIKLAKGAMAQPSTFAFSLDKTMLATTDFGAVQAIGVWDLTENSWMYRKIVDSRGGDQGAINSMVFSPDSRCLLTSSDYDVKGPTAWSIPERIEKTKPMAAAAESADVGGQEESKLEFEQAAVAPQQVAGVSSMQPEEGVRVTVTDFMRTLKGLIEESQLEDIRKQLQELAQTSPDNKIEESLAQQIVDDVLHASAPRALVEPEEPMPALEEINEKEEAGAAPVPSGAPGLSRRLTVKEAKQEFPEPSTIRKRSAWAQRLQDLAAKSPDKKVNYEDAWELYQEIKQ